MHATLDLAGTWDLRQDGIAAGPNEGRLAAAATAGWLPAQVPGGVHEALVAAGRIKEPLTGLNSFACRWLEHHRWWFRRTFTAPGAWREADRLELRAEMLDCNARVLLNGFDLGSHPSAFRPFSAEIKPYLRFDQENELLIGLTHGLETATADYDWLYTVGTEASRRPERGETRRVLVRKPQYVWGWDWGPRLATIAIGGSVQVTARTGGCLRDVALVPERRPDGTAIIRTTVTAEQFACFSTAAGRICLRLTDADGSALDVEQAFDSRAGINFVDLDLALATPRWWWPNGQGEPHRYRVEVTLSLDGTEVDQQAFDWGMRTVQIDTADGRFAFRLNGRDIFAKGAAWVPPDALYARATPERYESLIHEACAANFNMLRVWGGGRYEADCFYDLCDRYGLLVWQDFMFACGPYPDGRQDFRDEVAREADYQTRRLRRHACLALWCGNNENHWCLKNWLGDITRDGVYLYNDLLPRTIHANCPEIPYWNGSPFGGPEPNAHQAGDCHEWPYLGQDSEAVVDPTHFDRVDIRFLSEFGYIGPCSDATWTMALKDVPGDRRDEAIRHHTNTFAGDKVGAAIRRHLADPEALETSDFRLLGALSQGILLGYVLESCRARNSCDGTLFWMFNDVWPEDGWTIVDYGLRRKLAWWFVRRAFAPRRLILRPDGDSVLVMAINGTAEAAAFELDCGWLSPDGGERQLQRCEVHIAPWTRTDVARLPTAGVDPTRALWVAIPLAVEGWTSAPLALVEQRRLALADSGLRVEVGKMDAADNQPTVTVSARGYVAAAWLDLPDGFEPEDNAFPLLPGESRRLTIAGGLAAWRPEAVQIRALPAVAMPTGIRG